MGYGVALQVACLEGFDSLGLHQVYAVGLGRGHVLRILDSRSGSTPLAAPIYVSFV